MLDVHPLLFAAEGADTYVTPKWWLAAVIVAPLLLAVELFLVPRHNPIPLRKALWFSLLWFALGAAFAIVIGIEHGEKYAIKYTSGFMVEKGLAIDQVLVFAFAVRRFEMPPVVARRVVFLALYLGLLMHLPFIALGSFLGESDLATVHVAIAGIFGAVAFVLFRDRAKSHDPTHGRIARWMIAHDRVLPEYRGRSLVVRRDGERALTMAGAVLVVLTTADLFFAATVPLAFSYSKPAFIVFSSATFALLGFRSLYSATAGLKIDIGRLKAALAVVFAIMSVNLIVHPFIGPSEPTWLLPALGCLAVLVPVVSAVRGIEEELEEEAAEEAAQADASASDEH